MFYPSSGEARGRRSVAYDAGKNVSGVHNRIHESFNHAGFHRYKQRRANERRLKHHTNSLAGAGSNPIVSRLRTHQAVI
jgi:hypothetical protein